MTTAIWFRRDLRLNDNTALLRAFKHESNSIVGVFILTPETWKRHHKAATQVNFELKQLQALSASLEGFGIPLKVLHGRTYDSCSQLLENFCLENNITQLLANREILVDEMQRDKAVKQQLAKHAIDFKLYHDATILKPESTCKKDGTAFKVFTPFKKNWLSIASPLDLQAREIPSEKKFQSDLSSDPVPETLPEFKSKVDISAWPSGEKAIKAQFMNFCQQAIKQYKAQRDFPALTGTSKISAYLACGAVSARQLITWVCEAFAFHDWQQLLSNEGTATWLSEIIWREFYYAICFYFPQVVKNQAFKPETDQLPWSDDEARFQAWCEGKTGFPLVDAGMRQLKQTGWMHNRLRMVTAMFLTKTLFVSWRKGEQFFMEHLIDGDFASNNGGWQWSASTGTDAVPYFRIFNPTTQSERFDPEGDFIREFCPELANCSNKEIHNPSAAVREHLNYPHPIVDYKQMRETVIQAFKALKN